MPHDHTVPDPADIVKDITVPLQPEEAFDLFTRRIADWWPVESHSLAAQNGETPKTLDVDPEVGGRIWETLPDGTRAPWARITEWRPGERFALDWHVGREEDEATQVTVAFGRVDGGTHIRLTHSGFSRLAAGETMCASYRTGWDHVLGHCYAGACKVILAA